MKFLGLSFVGLKVLRSHLWMSPIILSGQQERKKENMLIKRAPLHKILVQSGTFFWNPLMGAKYMMDITGHVSDGRRVTGEELR